VPDLTEPLGPPPRRGTVWTAVELQGAGHAPALVAAHARDDDRPKRPAVVVAVLAGSSTVS
jgi:hypothetical protein